MKLNEIFDTEVRDVQLKKYFNPAKTKRDHKNELGAGYYSKVRGDPTDPHQVKKTQHGHNLSDAEQDAFRLYAKIVSENQLWDYVHFPRIYKIKNVQDKNNNSLQQWKIEKLLPWEQVDAEELQALSDRYFHKLPDGKELKKRIERGDQHANRGYAVAIATEIKDAVFDGFFGNIKDETLSQAIHILTHVKNKIEEQDDMVGYDLHTGNFMYRRTNLGLQLVFSDPFA